jgi:hypothetical protein
MGLCAPAPAVGVAMIGRGICERRSSYSVWWCWVSISSSGVHRCSFLAEQRAQSFLCSRRWPGWHSSWLEYPAKSTCRVLGSSIWAAARECRTCGVRAQALQDPHTLRDNLAQHRHAPTGPHGRDRSGGIILSASSVQMAGDAMHSREDGRDSTAVAFGGAHLGPLLIGGEAQARSISCKVST